MVAITMLAACSNDTDGSGDGAGGPTTTTGGRTAADLPATTDSLVTTAPNATAPGSTAPATTAPPTGPTTTLDPLVARPFDVFVPSTYDDATPMPLVVLLHGYTASGSIQELYFQFQPLAEERGFLYVHPDGTTNVLGEQFWNATDACCGFMSTVDDSAYLDALVEQVQTDYNVDPKRIFFVGHSNGGFMSYRMACDHSDKVAAIASLAGATFADPADCGVKDPVSVLQIHGTADATIAFDGGSVLGNVFPSAGITAATWADYNECGSDTTVEDDALDLVFEIEGSDTSRTAYTGCPDGVAVELWTIDGGVHVPGRTPDMSTGIIDFLFAHPKP